jgi:molybdate transport system substrate-binding protein
MSGSSLFSRRIVVLAGAGALAPRAFGQTKPLVVGAAISLTEPLKEIGAAFTAATGVGVTPVFAGSPTLARQIEQGAPMDAFISADEEWVFYLQARKLIDPQSVRRIAGNRLALVAPAASKTRLEIAPRFALATALGSGRLAMADPKSVPAGRYGQAALMSLGVWKDVEKRVAATENVRAALALTARGEAPFAIVYATDARVEPKVRVVGLFPASTHPPIIYPAARVSASNRPETAQFLSYLTQAQAQGVLARYGFVPPASV